MEDDSCPRGFKCPTLQSNPIFLFICDFKIFMLHILKYEIKSIQHSSKYNVEIT
jgi:hypothetical protein